MESKNMSLDQVGPFLYSYFKSKKKEKGHPLYKMTLQRIADDVIGISYNNFRLRLEANNLKLPELQKVADYLKWKVTIELHDYSFSITPTLSEESKQAYEDRLHDKDKIIAMLESQLEECRGKMSTMKAPNGK